MNTRTTPSPQFYLTAPATCPYLPERIERKVFTHLIGPRATEMNDLLTQGGFRRSQNIAYRPACEACSACVSVRILAQHFSPSRSLQRVMAVNEDIVASLHTAEPSTEQFALFRRYLDHRHRSSGMSDMSALDYAIMVEDTHVNTCLIEYRLRRPGAGPKHFQENRTAIFRPDMPENKELECFGDPKKVENAPEAGQEGELLAVSLTDLMSDGLSMVYSFFNPALQARSLGTLMILDHIFRTQALGLPHVYLGYWVKGSPKMDYKTRYRPQEHLTPRGWELYEPPAGRR